MRNNILFLLFLVVLSGCARPYQNAAFRHVQSAGDFNTAIHSMGVALYQNKPLSGAARASIKNALDEQAKSHAIAVYAIDEYQRFMGMAGYGGVEYALKRLRNKTRAVLDTIHKYLGDGMREAVK